MADFLFATSAIASALERLGKEFRNLQRTEISETSEGFEAHQVCYNLQRTEISETPEGFEAHQVCLCLSA